MFNPASKYISNAYIVINFLKDVDIRGKQVAIEKAYNKIIKGQSVSTNVSDKDVPDKPRFILNDNKKQLLVSQVSSQLTLKFDSSIQINNQFDTIKKYVEWMMLGTSEFIDKGNLLETGLVATVNYPSKQNIQQINSYIYNNFIKANSFGSIETASCRMGFKTDELFINIELNAYELREGTIKPTGDTMYIKSTDIPLIEVGLQTKIDINNKPQQQKTIPDSGMLIVGRMESLIISELDSYLSME